MYAVDCEMVGRLLKHCNIYHFCKVTCQITRRSSHPKSCGPNRRVKLSWICTFPSFLLAWPHKLYPRKWNRANRVWDLESRSRQTTKVNMYHVTKCSLSLCFTVHYFYPQISSFRLAWSIAIVLDCLSCSYSILRNSKLASDVSISFTNVWSAARKRRSWTYEVQLYVYARPFIHYSIYARKNNATVEIHLYT